VEGRKADSAQFKFNSMMTHSSPRNGVSQAREKSSDETELL
jgi:hypothetical protein